MSQFDAAQSYVQERRFEPRQQGTSSLLLGLEAALWTFPLGGDDDRATRAYELWCELERREVPVDRVAKEAILPNVASAIGVMAAVPAMRELGVWDTDASSDFLDRLEGAALSGGWVEILTAAIAAESSKAAAREQAALSSRFPERPASHTVISGLGEDPVDQFDLGPEVLQRLADDVRLPYALSRRFTERVHEWLCRLVSEDLNALIAWHAPPPSVFGALRPLQSQPDESARWIWDRFTKTRLEEWARSSLLREWSSHRHSTEPLPRRIWQERVTDPDRVASLALEKASEPSSWRSRPTQGLAAAEFVQAAVDHLERGEFEEAANIYAGLAELRPADGDVLNNLGFCLMPIEAQRALNALQEASLYPRSQIFVSAANRVLALHLTGRDSDAIRLAEESLAANLSHNAPSSFMWAHDHCGEPLRLTRITDPVVYLGDLLQHLRSVAPRTAR